MAQTMFAFSSTWGYLTILVPLIFTRNPLDLKLRKFFQQRQLFVKRGIQHFFRNFVVWILA